jgi:hypothetical protein
VLVTHTQRACGNAPSCQAAVPEDKEVNLHASATVSLTGFSPPG